MIFLKNKKINLSWTIFLLASGLTLFGLLSVYNASSFQAYQVFGDKFYYLRNQALWAILGMITIGLTILYPHKKLKFFAIPLIILNTLLLVIVLIPGIGTKILGARRWLVMGNFSLQPSEFLKISLSIYLASWLEQKRPILPFLIFISLLLILIILEPDLGTGIIIVLTAFLVYFISGAPIKKLFFLSLLGLLLGGLIIFSSAYRRNRILTFLNPAFDPLGRSYHIRQVLIALGSGGFWGVGLGNSRQKYQYLPEATTDSIFAVIGEECGFLGGSILISLFLLLIFLGFRIAVRAKDRFSRLLACSLTIFLGLQTFINLGAMVSLLPLTGIPLPFISYGGSSLLVSMAAIGILVNISRDKK
jgi:cell division protein FtsW